ncbi:D-Ala-D-Ala dipeptidase [Acidovorax carolinensis]|uniref:D-Ala-D-Ala dipeptidase n=1 Tax=Acidovorax carolinensis TaxID=553814 RepID=A0A240UAQ9_9BURK|nr:M15 family metallopeptidase [Acidovorax carolinensis]ART55938.1 D-Ala-D-Ala dipeptidase [Acidovorax carolinensis]ART58153.1 D-Ala-D-Ala dipeptidase [Acidovorax carolinensis]
MHNTPQKPSFPYSGYWLSLAAGIGLSACVHSPQAAVPAPTLPPVPMAWGAAVDGCAGGERLRAAVASVRSELRAQGLALKTSCQFSQGALVVQVQVVDGLRASKVLRGPLADGEAVDMGTPAGVASANAASHNTDLSPDVQHNRQWLRALMARHQFDNLPDAWWRFAQKAAPQPALAEVDLAAR